jgi:hypothetical protein
VADPRHRPYQSANRREFHAYFCDHALTNRPIAMATSGSRRPARGARKHSPNRSRPDRGLRSACDGQDLIDVRRRRHAAALSPLGQRRSGCCSRARPGRSGSRGGRGRRRRGPSRSTAAGRSCRRSRLSLPAARAGKAKARNRRGRCRRERSARRAAIPAPRPRQGSRSRAAKRPTACRSVRSSSRSSCRRTQ